MRRRDVVVLTADPLRHVRDPADHRVDHVFGCPAGDDDVVVVAGTARRGGVTALARGNPDPPGMTTAPTVEELAFHVFTEIGIIQFEYYVHTSEEYARPDEVANDRATA